MEKIKGVLVHLLLSKTFAVRELLPSQLPSMQDLRSLSGTCSAKGTCFRTFPGTGPDLARICRMRSECKAIAKTVQNNSLILITLSPTPYQDYNLLSFNDLNNCKHLSV